MFSTTRRRPAALALTIGLAVAGATGASGCSHTPGVSNGSVSVCYRAIPVGRAAIHDDKAKLIGVHRIPVDQVRSRLPQAAQSQLAAEDDTAVCAMTFRDSFGPGEVQLASPGSQGTYAIVLVSSLRLHLVASVVLDQLPRAFGGRTI